MNTKNFGQTRLARVGVGVVLSVAISALLGSAALAVSASPAQDLFDQALYYLSFHYNGYADSDLKLLEIKYQTKLDQLCQGKNDCPYTTASTVIEAMLEEIGDGHSSLWTPEDYGGFQDGSDQSNPPLGLGVWFVPIQGTPDVRIEEVLDGGPAATAGVLRGDRITAFNGQVLPSKSPKEFYAALEQALEASPVMRLSILRQESERLELKLKVRGFGYDGLPWSERHGDVLRIIVPDFDTPTQVGPAIHALVVQANQNQTNPIRAIVVDLRNNGGGAATECLSGVGAFIGDVTHVSQDRRERNAYVFRRNVVYYRNQAGQENPIYDLRRSGLWQGKLAVLVNKESASCAELFAADVQFAKRGPVIGETTFGLGNTGSRLFELINGGAIQVTTSRSFREDGTPYPERVKPDIGVPDEPQVFERTGRDTMLERAFEILHNGGVNPDKPGG